MMSLLVTLLFLQCSIVHNDVDQNVSNQLKHERSIFCCSEVLLNADMTKLTLWGNLASLFFRLTIKLDYQCRLTILQTFINSIATQTC